jgi:guanylate kinase
MHQRKGLMIVLSSPSGGGKTTIAQRLLRRDKNLIRSVSCTTRAPRPGERQGRDYFFTTPAKFKAMTRRGAFLEWARVHQNLYGTPLAWVKRQLAKGKDVLLVVDIQGGQAIRRKEARAVLVFLKPPSLAVLQKRLTGRGSDEPKALKVRLKNAKWEMRQGRHYAYQVVNGRLAKAVSDVAKIIRKERGLNRQDVRKHI